MGSGKAGGGEGLGGAMGEDSRRERKRSDRARAPLLRPQRAGYADAIGDLSLALEREDVIAIRRVIESKERIRRPAIG